MALLSWPVGVNHSVLADGFKVSRDAQPLVESENNFGTTRARFKDSLRVSEVDYALRLNSSEVEIFDDWRKDIGYGATRFSMPVLTPRGYEPRVVTMRDLTRRPLGVDEFGGMAYQLNFKLKVENL